jgi:hypothetical protein
MPRPRRGRRGGRPTAVKAGEQFSFDKVAMPQIQGRSANVVEYNIVGSTGAITGATETNVIDWQIPIGECAELLALKVFAPANQQRCIVRDINNREWNTFCTKPDQEQNTLPFWNPYLFPKHYTLKFSEGDHLKVYVQPSASTTATTYVTAVVRRYKAGSVPAEVYKNFDIYKGGMKGRAAYYEQVVFDVPDTTANTWSDALTLEVTKNEAYYIWTAGVIPAANLTLGRVVIDDQIEYNQYTVTNTDGANELPFMETVQLCWDPTTTATDHCEYLKKMTRFNPVIKVVKNLNRNLKVQLRSSATASDALARIVGVKRVLV